MKHRQSYRNRLFRERLKWGLVIIFSAVMMFVFSPKSEIRDIASCFFHPMSFFSTEQLNPFNQIIEKVIPEDISDRLKQLMDYK